MAGISLESLEQLFLIFHKALIDFPVIAFLIAEKDLSNSFPK